MPHATTRPIVILGIFAADLAFRAPRLPHIGETLIGQGFQLGAGGKGSNQAVAAARAARPGCAAVRMITRVGQDAFGELALQTWRDAGIDTRHVSQVADQPTGAAFIYVSSQTGDNAIIVNPGAAAGLCPADLKAADASIAAASVFVTQLEQPMEAMEAGLRLARRHGVRTLLNPAPAPAAGLPEAVYALCDLVTPNEVEAQALTGVPVDDEQGARRAAEVLLARGVGAVVITLGARGAWLQDADQALLMPAFEAGPVLDTTGAGDAFNGALAVALSEGQALQDAVRLACAVASLSVTRLGTAAAMPTRDEAEALLARG